MELDGKIAIVTGSSRGIGRAMALGLAQAGAGVVVAARTETPRRRVPGTIFTTAEEVQALGRQALPVACDVRDEESVNNMVQKALGEFGQVDILVNNAGIGSYTPFLETPVDIWDRVLAVKVRGSFLCARCVLPGMIERGRGSIINISSLAADHIRTDQGTHGPVEDARFIGQAYGTANAALERLSRGLAAEMACHNIAVNVLKPAKPILTEGFKLQRPDADWSRWAGPEDMVKASVFLASQDASGLSGAVTTDEELIHTYNL